MRIVSLYRGFQRSAHGGAAAAAAAGRLPLPPSCLAALRSRFSYYRTAAGTPGQTPPDSRAAFGRERAAHGLASPRVRERGSFHPADLMTGCIADVPGGEKHPDSIELARFAVAEHNSKTNAALEFVRLVKVRHQLVSGYMYYYTVEVREVGGGVGANKLYEAKVWLKPWANFKGLSAFEPVANAD